MGIKVCEPTIQKVLKEAGFSPRGGHPLNLDKWRASVKDAIWALDFFFVRPAKGVWLNVLLVIDLHTREILELRACDAWGPTAEWTIRTFAGAIHREGRQPSAVVHDHGTHFLGQFERQLHITCLLQRAPGEPGHQRPDAGGVQPWLTGRGGDQSQRCAAAPAGPQALRSRAAECLRAGRRRTDRRPIRDGYDWRAAKRHPRTSMVWCTLGSIQPGSPTSLAVVDAGSARRYGDPSRHRGHPRAPRRGLSRSREGFLGPARKTAPWGNRARSDRRLATLLTRGKPAHVGLVSNCGSAFTA